MLTLGRIVTVFALSIGAALAAGNESGLQGTTTKFHIPTQSLIDALQIYSRQSGVQVMFETATVAG